MQGNHSPALYNRPFLLTVIGKPLFVLAQFGFYLLPMLKVKLFGDLVAWPGLVEPSWVSSSNSGSSPATPVLGVEFFQSCCVLCKWQ